MLNLKKQAVFPLRSAFGLTLMAIVILPSSTMAEQLTLESLKAENAFVFNTFLFLIGGFLVMFMAAGFAMLEAGLVRSKNVSMQCLKNISLYSLAGIMYWCLGYSLMYTGVDGGYFGTFGPYAWPAAGSANAGDYSVGSRLVFPNGILCHYRIHSFWHPGRAYKILAVSIIYRHPDRLDISHCRLMEMGGWMAG